MVEWDWFQIIGASTALLIMSGFIYRFITDIKKIDLERLESIAEKKRLEEERLVAISKIAIKANELTEKIILETEKTSNKDINTEIGKVKTSFSVQGYGDAGFSANMIATLLSTNLSTDIFNSSSHLKDSLYFASKAYEQGTLNFFATMQQSLGVMRQNNLTEGIKHMNDFYNEFYRCYSSSLNQTDKVQAEYFLFLESMKNKLK